MSLDKYATAIERKIAKQIVTDALDRGYFVTIDDGGAICLDRSDNKDDILGALATSGEDILYFENAGGARYGFIQLIYGNDQDCIADHTDNDAMDDLLKTANTIADEF